MASIVVGTWAKGMPTQVRRRGEPGHVSDDSAAHRRDQVAALGLQGRKPLVDSGRAVERLARLALLECEDVARHTRGLEGRLGAATVQVGALVRHHVCRPRRGGGRGLLADVVQQAPPDPDRVVARRRPDDGRQVFVPRSRIRRPQDVPGPGDLCRGLLGR